VHNISPELGKVCQKYLAMGTLCPYTFPTFWAKALKWTSSVIKLMLLQMAEWKNGRRDCDNSDSQFTYLMVRV
jgi:hypothetical protein